MQGVLLFAVYLLFLEEPFIGLPRFTPQKEPMLQPENTPNPTPEADLITEVEDADDEDGEYVIPPGTELDSDESDTDVDTDADDISSTEEEATTDEEGQTDPVTPADSSDALSDEELEEIITLGKTVRDYQKDHPGFDPVLTHKEFTRRSMELAELKRTLKVQEAISPDKPQTPVATPVQPVQTEDQLDLSKFDPEEVETFQKLAKSLGFVHKNDLVAKEQETAQRAYLDARQGVLNAFVADYQQYHPDNDPGDVKWKALIDEFSLFKLPEDPTKIRALLEKAHKNVFGASSSDDTKRIKDIIARKQQAGTGQKANAASPSVQPPKVSSVKRQSLKNAALRGALKGFSEEELDEMFGD